MLIGTSVRDPGIDVPYSRLSHPILELTNVHPQFFDSLAICSPRQRRGFIFCAITFGEYIILLLGIKVGCHPIFACFNLVRRIHLQLIDCSSRRRLTLHCGGIPDLCGGGPKRQVRLCGEWRLQKRFGLHDRIRQSNPPSGTGRVLMHCRHDGNRRG